MDATKLAALKARLKLDSARHEEMLEGVAARHGHDMACALFWLHKSYLLQASDMAIVLQRTPSALVKPYIEKHDQAYCTLAAMLVDAMLGDRASKDMPGIIELLAQMNGDIAELLMSTGEGGTQ